MSDVGQLTRDRGGQMCGNCRFYEVGECHRRSPDRGRAYSWGLWPHVAQISWCGEYEYQPSDWVRQVPTDEAILKAKIPGYYND